MDIDRLVETWKKDKGPFGDIGWCEMRGCTLNATKYVQSNTQIWWMCKYHFEEFIQKIVHGE